MVFPKSETYLYIFSVCLYEETSSFDCALVFLYCIINCLLFWTVSGSLSFSRGEAKETSHRWYWTLVFFISDVFSFLFNIFLVAVQHFPGLGGQSATLGHLQGWVSPGNLSRVESHSEELIAAPFLFWDFPSVRYHLNNHSTNIRVSKLAWDFIRKAALEVLCCTCFSKLFTNMINISTLVCGAKSCVLKCGSLLLPLVSVSCRFTAVTELSTTLDLQYFV